MRLLSTFILLFLTPFALGSFTPPNRPIDVLHYRIVLELDPREDPTEIPVQTEVTLKLKKKAKQLSLDAKGIRIEQIRLLSSKKKRKLRFRHSKNTLTIKLPSRYKKGSTLRFLVRHKTPIQVFPQIGLFKVRDPTDKNRGPLFFTQLEATGARRFFPCNDTPADKATTELRVTTPKAYRVISNGILVGTQRTKRKTETWQQVTWKQNKAHSTYLVSVAIGKFSSITTSQKNIPLKLWHGPAQRERARYTLNVTQQILGKLQRTLKTPYPWAKYHTISVPRFIYGGMENTSASHLNQQNVLLYDSESIRSKYRIVKMVGHELAHQWFGNSVTLKWWTDLWLNEAFANYFSRKASKFIFPAEAVEIARLMETWERYFPQETGPRSHPIVLKELKHVGEAFDAISYLKGENVLNMLRHWIGENAFDAGIARYLKKYAYKNATFQDFFSVMGTVTNKNLNRFRDTWLNQRGYPLLSYTHSWNSETQKHTLEISQASNQNPKESFVIPLDIQFHRKTDPGFHHNLSLVLSEEKQKVSVTLPEAAEWITIDPKGIALAEIFLKQNRKTERILQAQHDPSSVARLRAARRLFEWLQKDKNDQALQESLIHVLKHDPSLYVRTALLRYIRIHSQRWLPNSLGNAIMAEAQKLISAPLKKKEDPEAWFLLRSEILATLGRVRNEQVVPLLTGLLLKPILPLDEVRMAAQGIAAQGDVGSAEVLKAALRLHEPRGYPYVYWINYAFGALESPSGAALIQRMAPKVGPDLMGRIDILIRRNQTLRRSKPWTRFLKTFVLHNQRFGDLVKVRLLRTLENLDLSELPHIPRALQVIRKKSHSPWIRKTAEQILEK